MQTLTRVFLGRDAHDDVYARVASSAAGSFALKLAYTGLSFVAGVLLARLLGAAGYGAYAYAMASVALLGVPALLGLDNLLVREVSVLRQQQAWGVLRGLLGFSSRAVLVASCVLAGLTLASSFALHGVFEPQMLAALRVVALLLPLVALTRLRQATLQGLDRVVTGQLPESLLAPLLLVALVGASMRLPAWVLTPAQAVGLHLLSAAVAFGLGVVLLRRALPQEVLAARPERRASLWLRSGLPLLFVAGMHVLNSRTDSLMLGAIRGAYDVGIYGVASRGAEFIAFFLIAANPVLAPLVARLHAAGESAGLQRLVTRSTRAILLASLPLGFGLIAFGDWYLRIFGAEFLPGRTALAILSVGQIVNVATGPVGLLLIMTGHERDAARGVGIAAGCNVVLNALLIPRFGPEGAAFATATSVVLWNLLLARWVLARTGIHATALGAVGRETPA